MKDNLKKIANTEEEHSPAPRPVKHRRGHGSMTYIKNKNFKFNDIYFFLFI